MSGNEFAFFVLFRDAFAAGNEHTSGLRFAFFFTAFIFIGDEEVFWFFAVLLMACIGIGCTCVSSEV
jgi:hypothetical protein